MDGKICRLAFKPYQTTSEVFFRGHRYEITREYGHKINYKDYWCITISYFVLELFV